MVVILLPLGAFGSPCPEGCDALSAFERLLAYMMKKGLDLWHDIEYGYVDTLNIRALMDRSTYL